jgi:hypothetical protein
MLAAGGGECNDLRMEDDLDHVKLDAWRRLSSCFTVLKNTVKKWSARQNRSQDLALPRIHWGNPRSTDKLLQRINSQLEREKRIRDWKMKNSDLGEEVSRLEGPAQQMRHLQELFEHLHDSLEQHIASDADSCFYEAFELCEELGIDLDEDLIAEIDEHLEVIGISEAKRIIIPKAPGIVVPELILPAQALLIQRIAADPGSIFLISPRAFEELIAEIFSNQGFEVELTRRTDDGGRDVIAISNRLNIRARYIVECKRYAPDRKVSVQLVRSLLGVKISENANKAILATTSSFTKAAKEFSRNNLWHLDLKAYDDIMGWIRDYRVSSTGR